MNSGRLSGIFSLLLATGGLPACKEEPAAPAEPTQASGEPTVAASSGSFALPAYTEATIRRFRLELCFYGSYGVKVTRDAYLASLSGKEPSIEHLPSFGHFPELEETSGASTTSPSASASGNAASSAAPRGSAAPHASALASAKPSGTSTAAAGTAAAGTTVAGAPGSAFERLPYGRFLGSCTLAARKDTDPATDEPLDKAAKAFEQWGSALNQQLMAAHRYYGTKQYEADKFERGKTLHKQLLASFEVLDEKFGALEKAFLQWELGLKKPDEKLDKGGEAAFVAMEHARALAGTLLTEKPDSAAFGNELEALKLARTELEKLAKEDPKSPHPRELIGRLGRLSDAATGAQRALEKREPLKDVTFRVLMEVAGLVEANHRALGQLMRMNGQTRMGARLEAAGPGRIGLPGIRPQGNVRLPSPTRGGDAVRTLRRETENPE